jgi:hypothetical protein
VGLELQHIEAVVVPDPAVDVADADDHATVVVEQTGHHASHIAEPLNHHPPASQLEAQTVSGLVKHVHDSPTGRFPAPVRSSDHERLAGHHSRNAASLCHRIRVHHPRHGLLVGSEIRGGDVHVGSDERHDLGGVAPGHALTLP